MRDLQQQEVTSTPRLEGQTRGEGGINRGWKKLEPPWTGPTWEMLPPLPDTSPSATLWKWTWRNALVSHLLLLPTSQQCLSPLRGLRKMACDSEDSLGQWGRTRHGSENKPRTSTVQFGFLMVFCFCFFFQSTFRLLTG